MMQTLDDSFDDLSRCLDEVLQERRNLLDALKAAADAIYAFDGGDPRDVNGWQHDELRRAWRAARDVIVKTEAA